KVDGSIFQILYAFTLNPGMETVVVIAHVSLFFLTGRTIRHAALRMRATRAFNENAHTHTRRALLFKQITQILCSTFGNGNKLFGHEASLKSGFLTILVNYSQDAMAGGNRSTSKRHFKWGANQPLVAASSRRRSFSPFGCNVDQVAAQ